MIDHFCPQRYFALMKFHCSTIGRDVVALAAALAFVGGCASPLDRDLEAQLREELILSQKAYREAVAAGGVIEISRPQSEVEKFLIDRNLIEKTDKLGGIDSYKGVEPDTGKDLTGELKGKSVAMSLQRAVELAVKNNLEIRLAQIIPAISDTQVTQAEAVFDATLFSNFVFSKTDTPQPPTAGVFGNFGTTEQGQTGLTTGIRKVLSTGGQISVQTEFNRNERQPSFFIVPSWYDADITLNLSQPLLRNFGSDVTHSQIMLSQNAREEAVEDMKARMLTVVSNVEQVYWTLVFARYRLMIQVRLYEKVIELRRILVEREKLDTPPESLTDALSREELRRADVVRARQDVRTASDALKALIYANDLPLSGETMINPIETPADAPLSFSLMDSVTTALSKRPELRRALLEIKDASIRQRVADNQRLPRLDASFTLRYNSVGLASIGNSYDNLEDGEFIDYLLGLEFEVPIGNRGPEAALEQRKLERAATVVNYRRQAQQVVREVKDAMRSLDTAYEVIGAARAARRAAADRLRILNAQEKRDPLQIDLTLRAQETLAQAELEEARALTEYHSSIARYHQAIGTLLERNGVEFDRGYGAAKDAAK